jgi:hypothetical protein
MAELVFTDNSASWRVPSEAKKISNIEQGISNVEVWKSAYLGDMPGREVLPS